MRIVMDLQGAQSESRYRGIGRYTLALALAAARDNRGHDVHVVLNGAFADTISAIRSAFDGVLPKENIHVWHVPLPVQGMYAANHKRIKQAELIREAAIAALAPDLVHVSSIFEGYGDNAIASIGRLLYVPTVVTAYDMIPWLYPQIYLDPAPSYRSFYEERLGQLRYADALLTISETAMAEVAGATKADSTRVFNISAACDSSFHVMPEDSPIIRDVRARFGLDLDFILYSGGSDERKNLKRLIEAYAGLERRQRMRCRLVLAGRMHAPHVEALRSLGISAGLDPEELLFTGYVSEEELTALYNACQFFVFPSWHEGFGLPVLEAMTCGAAVLASNASSVKEVMAKSDALFDPYDVEDIRKLMSFYLDSSEALDELRLYSRSRARDFSWEDVARKFWDACERVHLMFAPVHKHGLGAITADLQAKLLASLGGSEGELVALADSIDRSLPAALPKIMLDVSELATHDLKTGIQRVTRAIAAEWSARPPEGYTVQLVRIDRDTRSYVCANNYANQLLEIEGFSDDAPLVCHAGDIFLGLDLVGDGVSLMQDWFEHFHNTGVLVAFVIYDLLPVRNPQWWPGQGGRHHERWLRGAAQAADLLLCISKATADDVAAWMDENQLEKRPAISWFHLGADIQGSSPSRGFPAEGQALLDQLSASVSFLMVGTLEPRKGHAQVLDAFERLWADGHDQVLVIVGKQGWLVDELCDRLRQHPEEGRRLFWLAGISDEFLERLYSVCSCLLAASYAEGFGLPLVEAAQRGMPLLVRDIPVFREVAGASAAYFDGRSAEAVCAAILDWTAQFHEGSHPTTGAMRWLTWQQSAAELAAALLPPPSALPQDAAQLNHSHVIA